MECTLGETRRVQCPPSTRLTLTIPDSGTPPDFCVGGASNASEHSGRKGTAIRGGGQVAAGGAQRLGACPPRVRGCLRLSVWILHAVHGARRTLHATIVRRVSQLGSYTRDTSETNDQADQILKYTTSTTRATPPPPPTDRHPLRRLLPPVHISDRFGAVPTG